ncbi:hypothetical protein BDA99DRAFT_600202 [Phascolomyces articulosus]|uniref:Uncharacterized protein n=1 Tax=Phascolomyces articulosus TaxID=60185 RepID=A0AAD5PMG4_9FUNG|nr:hypothetical protein BDA99DRAFT_600202 [Phascolomyces articulosus]
MVDQQFTPSQRQVFDAFDDYPWNSDGVFQAGLQNILEGLPKDTIDSTKLTKTELDNRQLLRAKHFFFTRFRQPFDLDQYLEYEKIKSIPVEESPAIKAYRRLDVYDFENDTKFLSGLPTIIRGWVKQQQGGNNWDKARMDEEYLKAKAFYYSACVESIDVGDYLTWTKDRKEASQSACPFAHMWQNKKGSDDTANGTSKNGSAFVSTEEPKITGAATISFSGPKSGNLLTIDRLKELSNELSKVESDKRVTTRVLRPVAASTSTFTVSTTNISSGQTSVKDGKSASVGLAFAETATKVKDESETYKEETLVASLDAVADAYYNFVLSTFQQQKTTVTVFDAAIPSNATYLALWHGFVRVINEDTFLDMGLQLSYAPIPPLLLLSLCRPRMAATKQPLVAGTELYLALAHPELVRLRAPELLRMGLADVFVPDARLSEAIEGMKRMAMCPEPDTQTALQYVLAAYHSYPGPDRLGVWEKEISQTFGAAGTLDELKNKLKELNTRWSNKILDHWNTLPPTLVEAVFKGVKACGEMDPTKVLDLERHLNHQWRRTKDFEQWYQKESKKDEEGEKEEDTTSNIEWASDEEVDFYFKETETENEKKVEEDGKEEVIIYEAPEEEEPVVVCPITGQRSNGGAAVCPVTGQAGATSINGADKCPVTGQSASNGAAAVCPVTGQREENGSSGCPINGKGASNGPATVCPVTGQKEENSSSGCPVNGGKKTSSEEPEVTCPVTDQTAEAQ